MIEIYCDGSCRLTELGKPGTWAYIAVRDGIELYRMSDRVENTTNNVMELKALFYALQFANNLWEGCTVYMDSQYVMNGITSWIGMWKRNNWMASNGKAVKNQKEWKKLDSIYQVVKDRIQLEWIRGHSGNKWNEKVDSLCNMAYDAINDCLISFLTEDSKPNKTKNMKNNEPIVMQGISLRQWYAGMAMQAMLAKGNTDCDFITEWAFQYADIMIAYDQK